METLRAFSKRGADIAALLRDLGFDPSEASRAVQQVAEQRSRGRKGEATGAPDATLRELWQREARERGWDPDAIARRVLHRDGPDDAAGPDAGPPEPDTGPAGMAAAPGTPADPEPRTVAELAAELTGAAWPTRRQPAEPGSPSVAELAAALADPETGLTAHTRRFSRVDALVAVADALPTGAESIEQIEALTDQVLRQPQFVALPTRDASAGTAGARAQLAAGHMRNADRYTTADVVAAERVI